MTKTENILDSLDTKDYSLDMPFGSMEKIIKKSPHESRAEKIKEKLAQGLLPEQDIAEASRIALKINDMIELLPPENQQESSSELLKVLNTAKDLYFYKELHDTILERKNNRQTTNEESNPAEPDPSIATRYAQIRDTNDGIRSIQYQYIPGNQDQVKINRGHGWDIISKDELGNLFHQSSLLEEAEYKTSLQTPEEVTIFEAMSPEERQGIVTEFLKK